MITSMNILKLHVSLSRINYAYTSWYLISLIGKLYLQFAKPSGLYFHDSYLRSFAFNIMTTCYILNYSRDLRLFPNP
jgi:hypothetical protein